LGLPTIPKTILFPPIIHLHQISFRQDAKYLPDFK
jgi:hypothetical protein